MELKKTTILPSDEKSLARRMFNELVHEEPYVLMVVLGKGREAETFVQRAAKLSGAEGEPRWVVWVRKPEQIADLICALQGSDRLGQDLGQIRGFSMSLTDSVRDVIPASEPVPSLSRILLAYVRAEGKEIRFQVEKDGVVKTVPALVRALSDAGASILAVEAEEAKLRTLYRSIVNRANGVEETP